MWDVEGKGYIDCTSQSWALYLGYSNEEIWGAIDEHAQNLTHTHQGFDTLTRFALAGHAEWKAVMSSLFGMAYTLGRKVHGVTDAFIEVNPRHVPFYERALGFTVAAGERFCERAKAPSILLRLELARLDDRLNGLLAA